MQKDTSKTRMKSFKIDNSKMSLDYRYEVFRKDDGGNDLTRKYEQFLCYMLECYFAHKDLLKDYFQKMLKQKQKLTNCSLWQEHICKNEVNK